MNQYLIDSAFAFLKQRILVAEQSLQLKEFALNLNLPLDDAIRLMTQFQQLHSLPCTHYMIVQDLVQEHKQEEIPLYRVILVSNEKAKQLRSTSTILKEHIHTLFPSGGSKQQNTPVCIVSHNSFIKPCECVDQSIETVYMQDENENMRKRKDFPSSPSSSSSSSLDYKKQKTHQQQTLLGFFSRK